MVFVSLYTIIKFWSLIYVFNLIYPGLQRDKTMKDKLMYIQKMINKITPSVYKNY